MLGPIVRVTPWEVHINDAEFLDEIYAPSHRKREKYAYQLKTLPVPLSMAASRTHDLHRRRREALNPFFSKKSVTGLESSINQKVEQLCRLVEYHQKLKTPVNLSDVYYGFALE
jgi:cytochrome P450